MRTHESINIIVEKDTKLKSISLSYFENKKDISHVIRKQQQRAIDTNMISIALCYGVKKYTFQDISYTITDNSLKTTPYYKFIHKLRGLTVIGFWDNPDNSFMIITVFWNYLVKSRKRY